MAQPKKKKKRTTSEQQKTIKELRDQLEKQQASQKIILDQLEDVEKELEEQKQKDQFIDIVRKLDKSSPSSIATIFLAQERLRAEDAIRKAGLREKDAEALIAGRGGYLGSTGDSEEGIPARAPLQVENVEAINLVKNSVFSFARSKKVYYEWKEWKAIQKTKWAEVERLKGYLGTCEMGSPEYVRTETEILDLIQSIVQARFDMDKVDVSEEWVKTNCPELYEAILTVRGVQIQRQQDITERSIQADEMGAVIKPDRKKGLKTSMEMREALMELSGDDE